MRRLSLFLAATLASASLPAFASPLVRAVAGSRSATLPRRADPLALRALTATVADHYRIMTVEGAEVGKLYGHAEVLTDIAETAAALGEGKVANQVRAAVARGLGLRKRSSPTQMGKLAKELAIQKAKIGLMVIREAANNRRPYQPWGARRGSPTARPAGTFTPLNGPQKMIPGGGIVFD